MSANWSQAGRPPNNGQQPLVPPRRSINPPPVCFNCGIEGHFLVACPEPNRMTSGGLGSVQGSAPAPYQQNPPSAPPPQVYHPSNRPPQQQYPAYPLAQSYGPPAPQYPYTPQMRPYSAPPQNMQYGHPGYQQQPQYAQPTGLSQYSAPAYQFPLQGPPHHNSPAYQAPPQQYGPPAVPPYQIPPESFIPPNQGYGNAQASLSNYGYSGPQPPIAPCQAPPRTYPLPVPTYNGINQGPQMPFQLPPKPNADQNTNYSYGTSAASQAPLPKWNNNPTPVPYQRSASSASDRKEYSAAATNQVQQTPRQSIELGSEGHRRTPLTSASTAGSPQTLLRRASQTSVAVDLAESKGSSRASTPFGRYGLTNDQTSSRCKTVDGEDLEEGETSEGEQQFFWDFKKIFIEPSAIEIVALAQPLSVNYSSKSSPVPLIQAWTTKVPSISRYARKDNEKEFVRSIRDAPQWSYLREDPAFSEVVLGGAIIPFDQLADWIPVHHGLVTVEEQEQDQRTDLTRKRSRSDFHGDDQDDVDSQIKLEAEVDVKGPPSKRQKKKKSHKAMEEPITMTPMNVDTRDGTPCLAAVDTDDAWAPSPGETSPLDPTEALLASLGVSGSPKPVKEDSLPPYMPQAEDMERETSQTSVRSQSRTKTPNGHRSEGSFSNNGYSNGESYSQKISPQYAQPNLSSANAQPINGLAADNQHGPPNQAPVAGQQRFHGPVASNQYGSPANAPFSHGSITTPTQSNSQYGLPATMQQQNNQYGPTVNAPYGSRLPTTFAPPSHQYGPSRNAPYNNGPTPSGPPNYPHYGPPTSAPYSTPQYVPPPIQPYGNGTQAIYLQGPSQYGPPQNQPHGASNPGPYGGNTQMSPTQYGPPQQSAYGLNSYPQQGNAQQASYADAQQLIPQYQNGQQPSQPYQHGPPQNDQYQIGPLQQPNHRLPSYGPPRQDSGYISARGSYSNGSGPKEFNQMTGQNSAHYPQQHQHAPPNQHMDIEQKENVPTQVQSSMDGLVDNSEPGTPLSPTSAEILGKLSTNANGQGSSSPLSPTSAEILGKLSRNSGNTRKPKRPAPVVEAAYSRRW